VDVIDAVMCGLALHGSASFPKKKPLRSGLGTAAASQTRFDRRAKGGFEPLR